MRILYLSAFVSFLLAALIGLLTSPAPIESQLLRVQLEEHLPHDAARLSQEALETQAFFVDHAHQPLLVGKARLALIRYPQLTPKILMQYGEEETFQKVLEDFGDLAIPPIQYFLENESTLLQVQNCANDLIEKGKQSLTALWNHQSDPPARSAPCTEEISPEQRGWSAIQKIAAHNHDFLGQFVVDKNGQVKRVQTERALEAVNSVFAGGIRNAETKWQRGETIKLADAGWAAVDLAIGISALKVLRLGQATAKGTQAVSFSKRHAALGSSLLRGSSMGLRVAKYGAPLALGYVALQHPSVLNSIFRSIAETLGLPVGLLQIAGWTLVLLPVVVIVLTLLKPLTILLSGAVSALFWLQAFTRSRPDLKQS